MFPASLVVVISLMVGQVLSMPKLYFYYSAMNAGKSTTLLQSSFNYQERGMRPLLFLPAICNTDSDSILLKDEEKSSEAAFDRFKHGRISSRIGLESPCILFDKNFDFYSSIKDLMTEINDINCLLIDEAQFLTSKQVNELTRITSYLNIPVLCYGLRSTYLGDPFEGAAALLTLADELTEIKTICHCGKKATMNMRIEYLDDVEVAATTTSASRTSKFDENDGREYRVIRSGTPIEIGGNDKYVSVCMRHFHEGKAHSH